MRLSEGVLKKKYYIEKILLSSSTKKLFSQMGVKEKECIEIISLGYFGGALAVKINRTILAIRLKDAQKIFINDEPILIDKKVTQ